MPSLAARITAAPAGGQLEIGPDEPLVSETLRIEKPMTLLGKGGVVLRGWAREALLHVGSPGVVIEGIRFERVPRPDGSASWGSGVVVEDAGNAIIRRCSFHGAADAWVVEPGAQLQAGEAWNHAGVDVRGCGHAVVEDSGFEGCSTALSASIYPADDQDNLVVARVTVGGGEIGVKATANARVKLGEVTSSAVENIGLKADNGSRVDGAGLVVSGTRVAVWADENATVTLKNVSLDAETAAIVVRGHASAALTGGTITRAHTAAEVHGLGQLRLAKLELRDVKVGTWARDAGRIDLKKVTFTGTLPQWGAYADVVAQVTADAALPGERSSGGFATVTGGTPEPWTLATWVTTLRERTGGHSAAIRKAVVEACLSRVDANSEALAELLFQWAELGDVGLAAALAAAPEGTEVPALDPPLPAPILRLKLGLRIRAPAAVQAMAAADGRVFASLGDGTLRAWDTAGAAQWTAKCPRSSNLIATNGWLVALAPNGSSDVLRAFNPETGEARGTMNTPATVGGLRVGATVELSTYDATGHPTDRCSWRQRWSPPDPPEPPECVAQGAGLAEGPWSWVSPDMGGAGLARTGRVRSERGAELAGNAVAQVASFVVVACDDAIRVYDGETQLIAVLCEPGVRALAGGPQLWVATLGGELANCEMI